MQNRYTLVSITRMQVKIASFLTDGGLLPVLTTTPYVARMLAARKETNAGHGSIAKEISGPIGYSAMVFMNSAGKLAGTENR